MHGTFLRIMRLSTPSIPILLAQTFLVRIPTHGIARTVYPKMLEEKRVRIVGASYERDTEERQTAHRTGGGCTRHAGSNDGEPAARCRVPRGNGAEHWRQCGRG